MQVAVASGDVKPVVAGPTLDSQPALSRDGHWLAYTSFDQYPRLFIRPFPNVNDIKIPVTSGGAQYPAWSVDGRTLYFRSNRNVSLVAVTPSGGSLTIGAPEVPPAWREMSVTETTFIATPPVNNRFLIAIVPETIAPPSRVSRRPQLVRRAEGAGACDEEVTPLTEPDAGIARQFDDAGARRVEAIYQTPDIVEQRARTLERLALRPGEHVLDLGCGPGLLAFEMAGRRRTDRPRGWSRCVTEHAGACGTAVRFASLGPPSPGRRHCPAVRGRGVRRGRQRPGLRIRVRHHAGAR